MSDPWDALDINTVVDDDDANDDSDDDVDDIYEPESASGNTIIITRSGAFVKFQDLDDDTAEGMMKSIRRIENYFTLRSLQMIGATKQSKRCKVVKKKEWIIVPRFGVYEIIADPKFKLPDFTTKSQISAGHNPSTPFIWKAELTENQVIISNYIMENIYTTTRVKLGSAGLILNLEAGQGKSFLAAYLMSVINKKTAIVLHSTALIDQWRKVIETCYPTTKVGYYYGKKKVDGDVILLIVDSALSKTFKINGAEIPSLKFYEQFGFIVFDECHEYANNNDAGVFHCAQAPYMLGLSATPDENPNKFDKMVWWEIGPVLNAAELDGYKSTEALFTATVHRMNYYGSHAYTEVQKNKITGFVSVPETVSMICQDPDRTKLILRCIQECLDKSLYTFVFADRRNYLEELRAAFTKTLGLKDLFGEVITSDDEFVRIVGGDKAARLEKAELKSRVIFTTYQYMGTGKSIIKMNGLVLATPRKSKMKQYIKRIFRLGSDTTIERHIYDIVDMKTSMKNQWSARNKFYKAEKFTIVETKIEPSAFVAPAPIVAKPNKPSPDDAKKQKQLKKSLDTSSRIMNILSQFKE